ncbi:Cof-type HAD-IIB family hydrolase [Fervidibacillus halotolerans]|uniref:Cof-type HAD-IIB family hydrolase n=1 Tax=Fervidibacillus halotolerans TaxID=2980027 RepID=A0A9E8M1E9_9BACI|nr:Cof-type HAD-IIB family hydrolase [Fervidibacillus halotolerans]WAA13474.1 Cof-type HAD-IIB family hydrolase [Fervidibacillus halotolerans]
MEITCIATDMDGTLLNENRKISEESKKAIFLAKEAGIDIVIATGRSPEFARVPLQESGIELPVICMNGAQIYSEKMERLFSKQLETKEIEKVSQILTEKQVYFEFYTNQGHYSFNQDLALLTLKEMIEFEKIHSFDKNDILKLVKERFKKGNVTFLSGLNELFQVPNLEIYKIIAFSMDMDRLKQIMELLSENENIAVTSSGPGNIEVTHVHAQKGLALEWFVQSKGCSLDGTMAIGDSFNDLSMLKRVAYPVAMGNAPEELKKIARYITDTNRNEGFAKAVYKILDEKLKR